MAVNPCSTKMLLQIHHVGTFAQLAWHFGKNMFIKFDNSIQRQGNVLQRGSSTYLWFEAPEMVKWCERDIANFESSSVSAIQIRDEIFSSELCSLFSLASWWHQDELMSVPCSLTETYLWSSVPKVQG
jgi:hypothetical protein